MRATGDPITAALGGRLAADQLAERIHAAGYDRPILAQYFEYLGQICTGDFGTTISDHRPVTEVLLTYGAATLELAFYALLVAFIVGIPLGHGRRLLPRQGPGRGAAGLRDPLLRDPGVLRRPAAEARSSRSGWAGSRSPAGRPPAPRSSCSRCRNPTGIYLIDAIRLGDPAAIRDVLQHAVLPALALGLLTAGIFLRLVRTNVIGTLATDYVEAARSRGVSECRLLRKHAYRPALIPIITVIGLQIALLLGGAVLTETTFEWKGLGFQLVAVPAGPRLRRRAGHRRPARGDRRADQLHRRHHRRAHRPAGEVLTWPPRPATPPRRHAAPSAPSWRTAAGRHQLRQSVGLQRGMLVAGLVLTGIFVLTAIFAPLLAPYGFDQLRDDDGAVRRAAAARPPSTCWAPPSAATTCSPGSSGAPRPRSLVIVVAVLLSIFLGVAARPRLRATSAAGSTACSSWSATRSTRSRRCCWPSSWRS